MSPANEICYIIVALTLPECHFYDGDYVHLNRDWILAQPRDRIHQQTRAKDLPRQGETIKVHVF
jgi:hypothetical protein